MKNLIFIAFAVLMVLPSDVQAQYSAASDDCVRYHFATVQQVVGVISSGEWRASGNNPGCAQARSPTQVLQFVGQLSGPPFLTPGGSITWSSALTGCTASAVAVVNDINAGWTNSIAAATVTMTSNECRGTFSATATIATLNWRALFPINIDVNEPHFNFLCDAPALAANAYNPSTTACNNPEIGAMPVQHWVLDSGNLRLENVTTNVTTGNVSIPMAMMLEVCGPGLIANGTCSPVRTSVDTHGQLQDLSLFLILIALGITMLVCGGIFSKNGGPFKVMAGLLFLLSALYLLAFDLPRLFQGGMTVILIGLWLYCWTNVYQNRKPKED